jgi:hypothetical protein
MGTHNERSERGAAAIKLALDLPLLLLLVSLAYFLVTDVPTRKSTVRNGGGLRGTFLREVSVQNPDVGGPAIDAGVLVVKQAG